MVKNAQALEVSRWNGWRLENSKALVQPALMAAVFALGWMAWSMPPLQGLSTKANHFLATMLVAVALWMLDIFDEYIVGLMLLLAWVVFGIVPAKVALAGFSENSWFFIVGSFGIAAAISKTSLFQRLALGLLRWIPIQYQKTYMAVLLSAGAFSTPLLPSGKARAAVIVPINQAIAATAGFARRSNGAAAIALAAFIGFTQMQFMFLTGAEQNLVSWNLLPSAAKAEFGWLTWFVAALPAALCISVFTFFSVQILLPLSTEEKEHLSMKAIPQSTTETSSLGRKDWIALATLILTLVGWLTSGYHGVSEAWVAMAALLVFLLTGILDKDGFRNDLDWGLILFFGVLNSLSMVAENLKIDAWLMAISASFLDRFAAEPTSFLFMVFVLVASVRFFLRKASAAALITIILLPLSERVGIHPGVLIVTALMSGECFLLGYQDGPYQIAYAGGGGSAFSHGQARKILAAKYIATLLAIAVSVPYWKFLGFIR
jgi:anion transporter